MKLPSSNSLSKAGIAAVTLLFASVGNATEFVPSPGLLDSNDSLTWEQLGAVGTSVANPQAVVTMGGKAVTVSQATGQGYAAITGAGFGPMYAPGERLYHTSNGFAATGGPITFVFAQDVEGFGVVCDPNFYLAGFAGTIAAFDADNNNLGTFPFSVSAQASYAQVFAGVSNSIPNIHRVVIDGTFAQARPEDFFIGTALISSNRIFANGFDTDLIFASGFEPEPTATVSPVRQGGDRG